MNRALPLARRVSLKARSWITYPEPSIKWPAHIIIFVLAAALIISRRPDVIFAPQFHTEDGMYYAQAYNFGWLNVLLHPYSGYLVVFERLGAALSLTVPFHLAPLVMNLVGIVVQVLPVSFLLSGRCLQWGSLGVRLGLAAAYIALPSSSEINVTMTSAQWHLALLSALCLMSQPAENWGWKAFDGLVTVMTGLTGPYCLTLLPIALLYRKLSRTPLRLYSDALLGVASAIQLGTMWYLHAIHATYAMGGRVAYPLGANLHLLSQILAGQVFINALVGGTSFARNSGVGFLLLSAVVSLTGVSLLVYTAMKARLEYKLFSIFSFLLFAASLESPLMSDTGSQWAVLAGFSGCRYFFFPMLAFVWSLIWCLAYSNIERLRTVTGTALVLMCVSLLITWRYPADPNLGFVSYSRSFEAAPIGTVIKVPIYPGGEWVIYLRKR